MNGKEKPPIPKYRYKLTTVSGSMEASRVEKALRERLDGSGLSFYAVCRPSGDCDVMGDSGQRPLEDAALKNARSLAAAAKKA